MAVEKVEEAVEENLVEQMKYIYGKGFKRLKDKVLGANSTYMIH